MLIHFFPGILLLSVCLSECFYSTLSTSAKWDEQWHSQRPINRRWHWRNENENEAVVDSGTFTDRTQPSRKTSVSQSVSGCLHTLFCWCRCSVWFIAHHYFTRQQSVGPVCVWVTQAVCSPSGHQEKKSKVYDGGSGMAGRQSVQSRGRGRLNLSDSVSLALTSRFSLSFFFHS